MHKKIEILPMEGSNKYVVRDESGLYSRTIPEALWNYLINSEMSEDFLIGSLYAEVKTPLLTAIYPEFKEPAQSTSSLTYEKVVDADGNYVEANIKGDGRIIFSGHTAPLVAEGMRIFALNNTQNNTGISYVEKVLEETQLNATEDSALKFLKVNIDDEVLFYESGFLLFSGKNAEENIKNYTQAIRARGGSFSTKEFTYTRETAPDKYLRDL